MTDSRYDGRIRVVSGGRLVWFGNVADAYYWERYWESSVTPDYYERARGIDLSRDAMGKLVRRYLPAEGRHVEAGCGAGFWVAALRANGYDIEGIDNSAELVEAVSAAAPTMPIRVGDACALDIPSDSLDGYLSLGVVEHRQAGPQPFLDEAFRVLRPGGVAIVSVPHFGVVRRLGSRLGRYPTAPPAAPFYQYGFTSAELGSLLRATGFRIRAFRFIGFHRLLDEESRLYRKAQRLRGMRRVRRAVEPIGSRFDGHMVAAVAVKPIQ